MGIANDPHPYALCWVVGEEAAYDTPVDANYLSMFVDNDQVLDVSDEYPDHNGITVRFLKNNEIINDFQTSEMFGAVLLSNPKVINLNFHKDGIYVFPGNAAFIDNEFKIFNKTAPDMYPEGWGPIAPLPDPSVKCYNYCGCDNCVVSCQCGWVDDGKK